MKKYPKLNDVVKPIGFTGKWEVIELDYHPENHNILVKNIETKHEMWISYDAIK